MGPPAAGKPTTPPRSGQSHAVHMPLKLKGTQRGLEGKQQPHSLLPQCGKPTWKSVSARQASSLALALQAPWEGLPEQPPPASLAPIWALGVSITELSPVLREDALVCPPLHARPCLKSKKAKRKGSIT